MKFEQELLAFCFMPNHYHFLVRINEVDKFVKLMRGFGSASAIYFNKKYNTVGHLCQGRYRHRVVEEGVDLIYMSRYIHRNPLKKLTFSTDKSSKSYINYKCSSLENYLSANSPNEHLRTDYVLEYFKSRSHYLKFVQSENFATHLRSIKRPSRLLAQVQARIENEATRGLDY